MEKDVPNTRRDLVHTIKNRCRVCYTCVRECPAKAIKIINGQAEVLNERCIACGNCIKVCSQEAKMFIDTTAYLDDILNNGRKNIAIVAPSFPAEFSDIPDYQDLVSMIRALGFDVVTEVAFGADLVAMEYNKLIRQNNNNRYISSDCPAIVQYIEKYHPELVPNL
ncbi:MAG: [Fe-Fe] hydrogenase large subunit C-terminal domain-containing protein, partial [Bacteroidota bacterium]